ncbi:MAG: hypothetical protein KDC93_07705 [Cyclobacteriaceae bacterium]|nr:hypothetical protein [Cyclobacteriaceae bacterium]
MKLLTTNILLLLCSFGVLAQKADTIKNKYMPTGIRIGTDLIALAKIPLSDQFDGWEVSADVDLYKYYLTFEYGNWQKTKSSVDQSYSNSGNYFRVGGDVNLLLKDPDRNMFFVGLRYGRSSFDELLTYNLSDAVFGNTAEVKSNKGMVSGWGEVTVGLRVKLWRELWMGYTARLKMSPSIDEGGEFIVYDIPGYGLASKRTYWGFNYQLYWRFPVRN